LFFKEKNMPANELTLKSIEELKGYSFVIPSYQRGYRWGKDQVNDLINDINEFAQTRKDALPNDFYCLQPIVLKAVALDGKTLDCLPPEAKIESGVLRLRPSKKEESEQSDVIEYRYSPEKKKFIATNRFEVIDGQQRLTTIFLILNVLGEQPFDLSYETREDTTTALTAPEKASDERIDQWHIKQSWKIISQHKALKDEIWKKPFLNHTKVIWYEPENLSSDKDSIEIFSRINRGKIPLTNSELIRALFILETKKKKSREFNEYKIAAEWNFIEQQLHNNEFWCFITLGEPFEAKHLNKKEYPNRIEFLFDLIEEKNGGEKSHQTYFTFNMYAKKVKDGETVETLWQEIKNLYYRFHEWFIDDELYHLIGYLRLNNWMGLNDREKGKDNGLLSKASSIKQSELITIIKDKIKEKLDLENIDTWMYGGNNDQIKNALLIHNIAVYAQRRERFPFKKYTELKWDIEHIHARSDKVSGEKEQEEFMGQWISYFKTKRIDQECMNPLNNLYSKFKVAISPADKDQLFREFDQACATIEETENRIQNLALLDKGTNRSYKNAPFSVKREEIIKVEREKGLFILPGTKDVFSKAYSFQSNDNVVTMVAWGQEDRGAYRANIVSAIEKYLNNTNKEQANGSR